MKQATLKFFFSVFIGLFLGHGSIFASDREIELESLKAAFIYKFTNYIEWPKEGQKPFNIAVVNNPDLFQALKSTFEGKLVRNRPVVVKHLQKLSEETPFDIVHAQQLDPHLSEKLKKIHYSGLLIISQDNRGLGDMAIINFYLDEENKLRFEINNERATINGLKINSRLLNLSRPIK